jgi:hypothetical protein
VSSPKIVQSNIGTRLTYKNIAKYIRENRLTGYFVMANSDIFSPTNSKSLRVRTVDQKKQLYAYCDEYIIHHTRLHDVINDPLFIKSYHYHRQQTRDYGFKDKIPSRICSFPPLVSLWIRSSRRWDRLQRNQSSDPKLYPNVHGRQRRYIRLHKEESRRWREFYYPAFPG